MLGVYLSGTGNTKHCIEKLLSLINKESVIVPIENNDSINLIKENKIIYLAYPTQFSNIPYMVRDFIIKNKDIWKGKNIFLLTTMGAFSGDGTGCAKRILSKYGAKIIGGLQIHMPDAVADSKMLKKTFEENQRIIMEADKKIEIASKNIINKKYPKEGLSFFSHLLGLFGQRLYFFNKTNKYSKKLKINNDCIGCGLCVKNCPMSNLIIKNGKVVSLNKCTMCYRCISQCPKKAITLLGKKVYEQCRFEKYCKE